MIQSARPARPARPARQPLSKQQNDKTQRILKRALGADWAQRYLETRLFDVLTDGEVVSDSSLS